MFKVGDKVKAIVFGETFTGVVDMIRSNNIVLVKSDKIGKVIWFNAISLDLVV